ncbi:MAG TPA: response regulator [Longimicrobiales bacterium]
MARTVLVADDELLTAEMLALMLAFRGFEVVCAHDGIEALQLALEHRPDVILLDVLMPELEGVDVVRAVRNHGDLARIPVVLFSSCDECEVNWREAGANLFLQKPINVLKLPELVERLLEDGPPPEPVRVAA